MDPRPRFVAHDIPDLLNALPTFVGFRPVESLVAVATYGPRRRLGFRMRVDLPPPDHVDLVAQHVVAHLRRQEAEGAIVLAVTEHQDVARDLTLAVEALLDEIEPVVVARSDGRRYWVDVPGFPADGVPYDTDEQHVSIVSAIAAGQEILPDREALVARWAAVDGPRRVSMQRAFDAVEPHVAALVGFDRDAGARGLAELRPVLDSMESGRPITDAEVALLCVWLGHADVRDAVWRRIRPDDAVQWLPALAHAARSVVPPHEPAVLCLAAFAAWLTGDGTQAAIAAERAAAVDPGFALADVVLGLVGAGVPPSHWRDVA